MTITDQSMILSNRSTEAGNNDTSNSNNNATTNVLGPAGTLGYYNANGTSSIVETLPTGTFLSIEGGDYASIADTSKTYHVDINGIRDGKFALTVNLTGTGGRVVTLQYPETAVRNGTTAQMDVNADMIAAQVSNNNASAVANATTSTNISTVPPALVVNDNNGSNSRSVLPQVTISHVQNSNASSDNTNATTTTTTTTPPPPSLGSGSEQASSSSSNPSPPYGGRCLIATAAFGSELAPQVQFLRNFRDQHILSTAAGSSFMDVFNAWYYSFSPNVANAERENKVLQESIKYAIYPLLGILTVAEKVYSIFNGEAGALAAGFVASSMIGFVYFWPVAYGITRFRKRHLDHKVMIYALLISLAGVTAGILVGDPVLLKITASAFVLVCIGVSVVASTFLINMIQVKKQ